MSDDMTKESFREIVIKDLKNKGVTEMPDIETIDMLVGYFADYMMSDDNEYCINKYFDKIEEVKNELSKKGKYKS